MRRRAARVTGTRAWTGLLGAGVAALAVSGCGSAVRHQHGPTISIPVATPLHGHPQAVEPLAGTLPGKAGNSGAAGGARQTEVSTPGGRPLGPASVTSAPAAGAPTDAQVRAAFARLQLVTAQYHLDQLDFSGVMLNPAQLPPGVWNVSIASFYDDFGSGLACGGTLSPRELGVANKTLPCGTKVIFKYGNRVIEIPVIDRGPYIAGREWDLTAAAATALNFPGLGPIEWRLA